LNISNLILFRTTLFTSSSDIGTKGIKSISSEKFTPLKVFDMASIYKGYIDSFVPTATGIIVPTYL
jgi:hypothetical protein